MTIEEFNQMSFGAGMKAIYNGSMYKIISCNFPEALIGLIHDNDDPDDMDNWQWVRCENVIIGE